MTQRTADDAPERADRAAAAAVNSRDTAPRKQVKRMPPLLCTTASESRHAPLKRRWIAKTESVAALTFALLIAFVTTVPANALMSRADVEAAAAAGAGSGTGAGSSRSAAAQVLHPVQSDAESVLRESFSVDSAEHAAALLHMRLGNTFTNDPNGSVQWPFPVGVPISDGFGPRTAPTEGASTFHEGVDFDPGIGVPIQIIADGIVRQVFANDDNGCGVHVVIDHIIDAQPVSSVYCHMQLGSVRVTPGDQVKVGDIVGLVGNTGISTGAHLHFEIRLNGNTAVDPLVWLKANAS